MVMVFTLVLQDSEGGLIDLQGTLDCSAVAAREPSSEARVQEAAAIAAVGKSKYLGHYGLSDPYLVTRNLTKIWFIECVFPRLVFPSLQKNDSPFTILPTFIQVLGKKIDSATNQKDRVNLVKPCMHDT